MSDANLRAIALRARLEADLSRLARRNGLNTAAVPDVAARFVEEGLFTLGSDGRLQSASGESLDAHTARLLENAPFYRDTTEAAPKVERKPDLGRVGDGRAGLRLDFANEAAHAKERAK